eukprot:ANDGO_03056.mRNA.1 Leucine-rich repeat-containing protein egg-6
MDPRKRAPSSSLSVSSHSYGTVRVSRGDAAAGSASSSLAVVDGKPQSVLAGSSLLRQPASSATRPKSASIVRTQSFAGPVPSTLFSVSSFTNNSGSADATSLTSRTSPSLDTASIGKTETFRTEAERLRNPERLNLDRHGFSAVPRISEEETALKLLNLQNNSITSLRNAFSQQPHLSKLIFLDLFSNAIDDLTGLDSLPYLRVLMVGKNRIRYVGRNHFSRCRYLDVLDLHSNEVSEIDGEAFSMLSELRVLNLAGNKLERVNFIKNMPSLTELNLRRNHISEVLFMETNAKLLRLFLSNNMIRNLQSLNGLIMPLRSPDAAKLPLAELSLDGNMLDADHRVRLMAHLPSLKFLDHQKISDVERQTADDWIENEHGIGSPGTASAAVLSEQLRPSVLADPVDNVGTDGVFQISLLHPDTVVVSGFQFQDEFPSVRHSFDGTFRAVTTCVFSKTCIRTCVSDIFLRNLRLKYFPQGVPNIVFRADCKNWGTTLILEICRVLAADETVISVPEEWKTDNAFILSSLSRLSRINDMDASEPSIKNLHAKAFLWNRSLSPLRLADNNPEEDEDNLDAPVVHGDPRNSLCVFRWKCSQESVRPVAAASSAFMSKIVREMTEVQMLMSQFAASFDSCVASVLDKHA